MVLTYYTAYRELINALTAIYDNREAAAIANIAMESITSSDRLQRIVKRDEALTESQQTSYYQYKDLLLLGTPIQYCTHQTIFMGNEYYVDNRVLIPRPETEELVDWILSDNKEQTVSILDIGTGSGCIPISLKEGLADANITSLDISKGALEVAQKNATTHQAEINFQEFDFLNESQWDTLGRYNIIVSNPPYIPVSEQKNMHINVKDHEPQEALFVPEDDALLFYRKIALFGKQHIEDNGTIYCELHIDHAHQTKELFQQEGYASVEIRKDMHGNWRMLKAIK